MSNVYDLAHQLARAIKNSQEYRDYVEKKNIAYKDKKNKEMIEDFRKKVLDIQIKRMSGKEVSQEEMDKLKKLEEILRLNPTVNDFLMAEFRYSRMIEDISKILGDAIDLIDNN